MTAPALDAPPDPAPADRAEGPKPRPKVPLPLATGVLVMAVGALAARGRPLWLDEAYSLAATRNLDLAFEAARGSMGLYYAFIWLWGQAGDGALWLRLPSLVAMGAAVALFTRLVDRHHGRRAAAGAGVGVALSFAVVRYAPEARSYALVCLAVVGAWSTLDRGLAAPDDRGAWRLHRLCCVALPLLHGLGAVQLVVQAGALAVAGVRGRSLRQASVGLGAGLATVGGALAVGSGRSGDWLPPLTLTAVRQLVHALTVPVAPLGMITVALVLAGSALLLRQAGAAPRGLERFRLVMPVAWGPGAVALVLAISVVRPSYLARYAITSAFGVVLVLALAAGQLDRRRVGTRRWERLPLATLLVVVLMGVGSLVALGSHGDRWDEATAVVADGARPGDAIVFPTADARLPFEAEWRRVDPEATPHLVGAPGRLGTVHRLLTFPSTDDLAGALRDEERVWVVTQPYAHVPNPDLLGHPDVRSRFDEEATWDLGGGISVTLLTARP